jgi:lytic murein transglycosylase
VEHDGVRRAGPQAFHGKNSRDPERIARHPGADASRIVKGVTPFRVLAGLALTIALVLVPVASRAQQGTVSFETLKKELWPLAQAQGISRATFDLAFRGLAPDARVAALTKRQPEYGKPIGEYVAAMASPSRIENGKRKSTQWSATFAQVEQQFGVPRGILLGIWGIETSYGGVKDRWDVVRSLATLVNINYRAPYFRKELLAALKILQDGHISRDKFLGSWAGAMGQPQFMPSNFYIYAVDFSGDGKRDIWSNVPDVLGSMGNYLKKEGWEPGLPWGFEVIVPAGFDTMRSRGTFGEWKELGFARADGGALPDAGDAILFFPSGAAGPAFLVTHNFNVIKLYNNSDVYALSTGHLGDRIAGGAKLRATWPANDRQLSREQRMALQKRMAELGYKVRDFQGRIDFDLRDAIRLEQKKLGIKPDGHPTITFLNGIGAGSR